MKKLLFGLLSLALCVCILPAFVQTAEAVAVTEVTVAGQTLNADAPYYKDGAALADAPDADYLHFDAGTGTLTTYGTVEISYDADNLIVIVGDLILAGTDDDTLRLNCTNSSYNCVGTIVDPEDDGAVWVESSFTITGGNYFFETSGTDSAFRMRARRHHNVPGLTITGGTVTANTLEVYGKHIVISGDAVVNANLFAPAAAVTISGNAQVYTHSTDMAGIFASYSVTISENARVEASGSDATSMYGTEGVAAIWVGTSSNDTIENTIFIEDEAVVIATGPVAPLFACAYNSNPITMTAVPDYSNYTGDQMYGSVNADGSDCEAFDPANIESYQYISFGYNPDPSVEPSDDPIVFDPSSDDAVDAVLNETTRTATGNIYGTYWNSEEAQTKYYVDVIWGNFNFTYYATASENWDPTKHTVEGVAEGDWRPYAEEDASITVVNHSNIEVTASLEVTPNNAIEGELNATFTEKSTRHATVDEENASITLENAMDVSGVRIDGMEPEQIAVESAKALANAPTATVLMALSGGELADDHAAGDPIATVTVTLQ